MKTSDLINILASFCGRRDLRELSKECLFFKYGIQKADVMVLFGGSILAGGDVLAEAIKEGIAEKYVIVGGAGHTTGTLRKKVHEEYSDLETEDLSEAEIFQNYLWKVHSCQADLLETRSTNCGNNITFLLDLLRQEGVNWSSIILCQDATMQQRMDAGMRKYVPEKAIVINFASYLAQVHEVNGKLEYVQPVHGMWEMERYVNLLMGEIPRLSDNENGYGPRGKNFIAHVDIPKEVLEAFYALQKVFGEEIRAADSAFASVADSTKAAGGPGA